MKTTDIKIFLHKGYAGEAGYYPSEKLWVGKLVGIKDLIMFEGTTFNNVEKGFQEAVDDYLEFHKEIGETPKSCDFMEVLSRLSKAQESKKEIIKPSIKLVDVVSQPSGSLNLMQLSAAGNAQPWAA